MSFPIYRSTIEHISFILTCRLLYLYFLDSYELHYYLLATAPKQIQKITP